MIKKRCVGIASNHSKIIGGVIKKLKTRRMARLIIFPFVLLCLLVVIIMQVNTNGIMDEIERAFFCPDFYVDENRYDPIKYPELYADPTVNYIIYQNDHEVPILYAHFNITSHSKATMHLEDVNIDLKLRRVFALHDFRRGTLWIKYSLFVTDKEGVSITGLKNVPVKLAIQKVNGAWEVIDLYEAP